MCIYPCPVWGRVWIQQVTCWLSVLPLCAVEDRVLTSATVYMGFPSLDLSQVGFMHFASQRFSRNRRFVCVNSGAGSTVCTVH